jgi:hypothetical protein
VTLNVPPESAAAITTVMTSGAACTSAKQSCEKQAPTGGCSTLLIVPQQPGTCHVEVDFADGTVFVADVPIVEMSGCCAGLYAHPPSAGQIDVPPGVADAAVE